jgi:hypothetical protein
LKIQKEIRGGEGDWKESEREGEKKKNKKDTLFAKKTAGTRK